jgi:predicted transcriptional regulator
VKLSDPSTAFRLPQAVLAAVDSFCAKQDLTRSQIFRRSVVEYLKSQNIKIITEADSSGQRIIE